LILLKILAEIVNLGSANVSFKHFPKNVA